MYKYEKKIEELGYQKKDFSKGILKYIKVLESNISALNDVIDLLSEVEEGEQGNEEREILQEALTDFENVVAEKDAELVDKIEKYVEKKPYYAQKYQHMMQKKQENERQVVVEPKVVKPLPIYNMVEEPIIEKKNSSNSWLVWGGLGVIGLLVGVNLYRNR